MDNKEREVITVKAPHKPFLFFIATQMLCLAVAEGSRRGMYPAMLYIPATTLMSISLGWFIAVWFYLERRSDRKQPASPATQATNTRS